MASKQICILLLAISFTVTGLGQRAALKRAEKAYEDFGYVRTAEILTAVAEQGDASPEVLEKLANALYFNNEMESAAHWYGELFKKTDQVNPELYFRYSQALKSLERYKEADKWMRKFTELNKGEIRSRAFLSTENYLEKISKKENDLTLRNLEINSENSDFGVSEYRGRLVFASSRGPGEIYKWTGQPFLDLYTATKTTDTNYEKAVSFDKTLNSKFHESSAVFTADEKTVFFTRNIADNKRLVTDKDKVSHLGVYKSEIQSDGTWGDVEALSINSKTYSVAHLTINAKGDKVYFVADLEDSFGSSDIYVADLLEDNTIANVKNLGSSINTEASESFPFVNISGDLYFSSIGWPGLGGMDIFVVKDFETKFALNQPLIIENVGLPLNSSHDDFAYYENSFSEEGFISSNRPGGKGDDDIYIFKIPKCLIQGVVKNANTMEPIPDAQVIFSSDQNTLISERTTGSDATFEFAIECGEGYLVRGQKEGYTTDEKRGVTKKYVINNRVELLLTPNVIDLGPLLEIDKILFDFDKSNIRSDAALKLDKLVAILKKLPSIRLDIRSHTDSRGNDVYNMALSDRRAKSTMQYLIDNGINAARLTAQGYGESQLVNGCSNGVKCSQEEHQANRRSEFIVVNVKDN